MLTLINKNYRSTPCSQNIVQILSLFLKNSSIFPSNNFWIFRPKYSNIRIIFGFWKCPRIEYEYQYLEENIRIFEYIRIFVTTLFYITDIWSSPNMWTIELYKPIIFRQTHGLARPDSVQFTDIYKYWRNVTYNNNK